MSRKIIYFLSTFILVVIGLGVASFVFAQGIDLGIDEVDAAMSLSSTDPRIIIAKIINIALLFLGVIAVGLIIYAGFIWMTSGGSEDKIDQAKKILRNAVIGLIIVLSAWGIATFVLTKLMGATNGGGSGNGGGSSSGPGSLIGTGALGACTVERVYPEPGQKDVARNTSIILSFKEGLALNTVCQNEAGNACDCDNVSCNLMNPNNIRIFREEFGDSCASDTCPDDSLNVQRAIVSASTDNRTFIIKPSEVLGRSDGNTDYSVRLTNALLKTDGESIFKTCKNDFFVWSFEVSNQLDLTPPQVRMNGVFPLPDNERDFYSQASEAIAATASIQVQSCPNTYQAATIINVIPTAGSYSASAVIDSNYHGNFNQLAVVSTVDNTQAQLFNGASLLGAAAWQGNQITFPNFLSLTVDGHDAGSAWNIALQPEVIADRLSIGANSYIFAQNVANNAIVINPANCAPSVVASAINLAISGDSEVNANNQGASVLLSAKVAGSSGNNIYINTNNPQSLLIQAFSGGQDKLTNSETRHRPDRPMNSVIQMNFNEAINPILVSGLASEVADNIRVVNADNNARAANETCSQDADCASYNCANNSCSGNYLSGLFTISNMYKTVEFKSDVQCGQNACGDPIYCLPANSHLSVRLRAADLQTCVANSDCAPFAPFSVCGESNSFNVCQDENTNNYPVANLNSLNGLVDAASNSLDGNRNNFAEGPLAFYNENNPQAIIKDSYRWSFYISDQLMSNPPQITFIKPEIALNDVDTKAPIQINFNTLMLNESLRTGSVIIDNGEEQSSHHLLNIITSSPSPLGYWVSADNKDVMPLDGEPDTTFVYLNHTNFVDSVSYRAQLGSGLKDIYQNCFKPSAGLDCSADENNPSCCNGVPSSMLNLDGNCP